MQSIYRVCGVAGYVHVGRGDSLHFSPSRTLHFSAWTAGSVNSDAIIPASFSRSILLPTRAMLFCGVHGENGWK
jgi:hypothetical protein